ncbi:hypothetical protein JMJ35_007634 [Cladonia borealis]|uniref:Fungal N-terminal domain-containing protein n=1 Tax=Cladonia borealis TaxID=184061 RepID=A0AA39V7H2_9LECA|nr:hypothetical protein JMJ35_007634 [Cladonia borealis]
MSFGFSPSDVVVLVQLARATVRNSRKACGEYAELTRETTSLHVNLQRLERETARPESPINRPSDTCRQDLAPIVDGCRKALDVLDRILEKYNALSDEERSKGKLWKAVRFGNGELANVKDLRLKLTYYTSNLSLFLNMVSMGSMGVVEKQMYEAGGDLKDIQRSLNGITAHLMSCANKEGSVLTDYADDDKAVWREFRRELIDKGFSSKVIREHKNTIQAYVKELGSRGILDDKDLKDSGNVSEEIEDTTPAQATPQCRDEAMGSFEHKTSATRDGLNSRTGTTGHFDGLSGTVNRDAREDQRFSQQTQTAPTPLTMNNISDTLPSTTQADAEIDSVVESDSREVDKVDDRMNKHRSSSLIRSAQSVLEIAEEDTWLLCGKPFKHAFQYSENGYFFGFDLSFPKQDEPFEALSDPLVARGETLEFQEEAKGFLKVAEFRTPLPKRDSKPDGESSLRLSPLFEDRRLHGLYFVIFHAIADTIMNDLLQYGLREIDARPEKWRITKWPSPREKTKREGHKDEDKGKRSTMPPHTFPTEEIEMD